MDAGHADVAFTLIEAVLMKHALRLTVGALALGWLMFGSVVQAGIVNSGDINIQVRFGVGLPNTAVEIDFNGFANGSWRFFGDVPEGSESADVLVQGLGTARIGVASTNPTDWERLRRFEPLEDINSAVTWDANSSILHGGYKNFFGDNTLTRGPFAGFEFGYLGVEFESHAGTVHYGWIRYDVVTTTKDLVEGRITGWAYNSVAGEAIQAAAVPEPSAALLLVAALGAGYGFRRRRV